MGTNQTKRYWYDGSGRIELVLTDTEARRGYHSGDCGASVRALMTEPHIAEQVVRWGRTALRVTLSKYGAWDAAELADHANNCLRMVWIACADVVDNPEAYKGA